MQRECCVKFTSGVMAVVREIRRSFLIGNGFENGPGLMDAVLTGEDKTEGSLQTECEHRHKVGKTYEG